MIPLMLGFEPRESLVIIALENYRVAVTIRIDIEAIEEELSQGFSLKERYPRADFFIAAYSVDLGLASHAAEQAEEFVEDGVLASVVTNGHSYWNRQEDEPVRRPVPQPSLRAQAEFAGAGLSVLRDRQELVSLVQPAQGELAEENMLIMSELVEEITSMTEKEAVDKFKELTDRADSTRDLLKMGMLATRYWTLIYSLSRISKRQAGGECEMWQRVCRQMPQQYALPAVALAAICAWASGNGSLQSICLEIGSQINPDSVLLQIPISANQTLQPPSEWEKMRQIFLTEYLNWLEYAGDA